MLSIIPTKMVLSFFFNSRIQQTGIPQTGPNHFVENRKRNQDTTGLNKRTETIYIPLHPPLL